MISTRQIAHEIGADTGSDWRISWIDPRVPHGVMGFEHVHVSQPGLRGQQDGFSGAGET